MLLLRGEGRQLHLSCLPVSEDTLQRCSAPGDVPIRSVMLGLRFGTMPMPHPALSDFSLFRRDIGLLKRPRQPRQGGDDMCLAAMLECPPIGKAPHAAGSNAASAKATDRRDHKLEAIDRPMVFKLLSEQNK